MLNRDGNRELVGNNTPSVFSFYMYWHVSFFYT